MKKRQPPYDEFMGMLDCAWDDFKTYTEVDEPSKPLGICVILVGYDEHEEMTIKAGANMDPEWVKCALAQLALGMATGTMGLEQVPSIKKKRVV